MRRANPTTREAGDARRAWLFIFLMSVSVINLAAQQAAGPTRLDVKLQDASGAAAIAQPNFDAPSTATITGTIIDADAAVIPAAQVALQDADSKVTRISFSDDTGAFTFFSVPPGRYIVKITAPGFASWKVEDVLVHADENYALPQILLGVESVNSTVDAISQEDLAEQQISAEEKQRILGVLPNFYVSYISNAAPLTRKQKFKLAVRVSTDPLTFFTTGVTAGIEQAQNDFSGYGEGFSGYAMRYGATYGDRLASTMLGAAILPSLFHQDPRYFYKETGSIFSRALYAVSTVVICKGDNGHWQPNYSNVLGNLAAGGISSLYYPSSDRHGAQVTIDDALIGTATGAIGTLFQEFLLRRFTRGAPIRVLFHP
jgi:hypothetical protein